MESPKLNKPAKPSWIFEPENWIDKLDLAAIFPGKTDRRLEVDVGCGKGRFLAARAEAYPDSNFIGIDRQLVRLRKVNSKIRRGGLDNIQLLKIEASYAVEYLFPDESVDVFYIFFPDPWPKKRHHKRRLFSPNFMNSLYKTMATDGVINIATDHIPYFEAIHELFIADARFSELPAFNPTEKEKTDFELIFLGQNAPIGRCSFAKVSGAD